ncbi:MAG TPA: polyprenol phosphomannose-dependent alpha 1,6 mannosyltransferase MptB [Solirubrobacteraceae bacterium]|jgi:alpha-1,6-mannosyltransferase|nr:polyprenol phosphomannose-dependent alpha 1,6 mannosyltransferase MptB [Solirubrobacteraceae bacterium]
MRLSEPLGATPPGVSLELGSVDGRGPSALASPRGRVGLAGLLITVLLISLSAAHTELLLPRSLRPVPTWLAGAFGHVGLDIGLPGLIIALSLMFLSYALAVGATKQLSRRAVLASIAALTVLVLVAPPLLSSDLFSYIAYGRLGATYGINPYLHGPNVISFDPLYQMIGVQWTHTPTVYGPLFTALSYPLAGLGIAANVFAYKGIAALSLLVIVALTWKAARLRGMDPVKAVAFVGLNPVILVYGVGGGHNDLLMLAILVAGIYVLLRHRDGAGGAMIIAATAIKLTAGMLLPFALAAGAGRRVATSGRARLLTGAAIAAVVFGVLGLALFGSGPLHLLGTLTGIQGSSGSHSITGFVLNAVGLGRFNAAFGKGLHVAYAISLAWLIRRVWRGELDWITAAGWAVVGLLISAGLLMPWYIAWLIPLAALSTDRRLWLTAIGLTSLGLTSL